MSTDWGIGDYMIFKPVRTPCVGVCSTGMGSSVCRGCKRFAHEVIDWNAYSEAQRRIIEQRLAGFMAQVVGRYLVVEDAGQPGTFLLVAHTRVGEAHRCWFVG